MSTVVLSQELLARIAGWEVVKQAREWVASGKVRESAWSAPLLQGAVQEGTTTYRAGLVIKSVVDVDNLCSCRASRAAGTMCAHSVAVGLHYLRASTTTAPAAAVPLAPAPKSANRPAGRRLRRAAPEETGEAAELWVILPPNLAPALTKGKVMVVLEARWRERRSPLNALPFDLPFRFSESDARVLDSLEELAGGETPAVVLLGPEACAGLLGLLVGHPRVTLGKGPALEVTLEPCLPTVRASLDPGGEVTLSLAAPLPAASLVAPSGAWVLEGSRLRPVALPAAYRELMSRPVRIPRNRVPALLTQDWAVLQTGCRLAPQFRPEDLALEVHPPRFHAALAGGFERLTARVRYAYAGHAGPLGTSGDAAAPWVPDPASPTRYWLRDPGAEQAAQARLLRAGFTRSRGEGEYELVGQERVLRFFAHEFPRLQREWEVTVAAGLERSTARNLERLEPQFQFRPAGEHWFDLEIAYATGSGHRLPAAEIQRLLRCGQSATRLPNGKLALLDTDALDELGEVLRDCAPQQQAQGYRLPTAQAGFLGETLRQHPGWQAQYPAGWRPDARPQAGESALVCPPLGDLEAVLRPYQKQGVAWLWFLRAHGWGGILADEMGLGKTLQTLAYVRARRNAAPSGADAATPGVPRPTLVVCPTSLVFNWVAEASRFTPELRVLALHGPDRESRFAEVGQSDLVITSYALVRRDGERYRGLEFDAVVLDEAQHIKNRQTQNALAVKALRAPHRLVLTGTPLENSVLDLWSIFDFLMPGYLGPAAEFRERYEVPVTRDRDAAVQDRLARRVRPFLLRRLKHQVAPELPPKLEQIAWCELTEAQTAVYRELLEASRREVLEAVTAQGLARSRLVILTTLLRLRQACCDLRLLELPEVDPATASGKLEAFAELLDEVLDGGHRVLVFSQFVRMLTLLRERLKLEAIDYCYLDGSTPDRASVVERFQSQSQTPVFLISLKAGGTGLNLTNADTVIHFDPWWNPAVEAQATDRAHRLGQTKVVTSYKLITRGTVEEKILRLQTRKQAMIQAALSGEEQLAQSLSWEEIQELFEPG